jgi:hypothetical protein
MQSEPQVSLFSFGDCFRSLVVFSKPLGGTRLGFGFLIGSHAARKTLSYNPAARLT